MSARRRAPRPRGRARTPARVVSVCVLVRLACALLAACDVPAAAALPHGASAPPPGATGATLSVTSADQAAEQYLRQLKRLQVDLLQAGARSKFARLDAIERRLARRGGHRLKGVLSARPPRDAQEAGGPQGAQRERFLRPEAGPDLAPDTRANDRTHDVTGNSAQAEVSIAAWGSYVVAAWNDGESFVAPGPVGFGTSRDGGRTWTDGGGLPIGGDLLTWTSDPVVTVDEKTGTFYLAALAIAGAPPSNAIGVVRGRFGDAGFVWDSPVVARAARDTLPDKPWIAADSLTGNLYLAYTTFVRTQSLSIDLIEFQRSTDGNATWSPRMRLSAAHDDGLVHGARPAAGPDGELYVTWGAVDTSRAAAGLDHLRIRRSNDGGASFGPETDAAGVYFNFGSGAPGYNRGFAFGFPSIAVDRSTGPWRGRVYVAWMESLNFFDDVPALNDGRTEVEPNDAVPTPFEIGETLRAAIAGSNDVDVFAFEGERGQSVVFLMDSLATDLDVAQRILCDDGVTRLAYSLPVWAGRARFVLFTLPETGRYLLRVAPNANRGGGYRIRSGLAASGPERGRDHRDVFVAHSDDGRTWSATSLVTGDPPWFDDWLPEVVVSRDGRPYAMWYDWRDTPAGACGSQSNVYLARSDDGGVHWTSLGAQSSVATQWSAVGSNLAPNQGDYTGFFAARDSIHMAWADGRSGDPDVRTARHAIDADPPAARAAPGPRIEAVMPNPASGPLSVTIRLEGVGAAAVELLDLSGRRVRTTMLEGGASRRVVRLDTAGLRSGIFVLRVTQSGRSGTARVAIIR